MLKRRLKEKCKHSPPILHLRKSKLEAWSYTFPPFLMIIIYIYVCVCVYIYRVHVHVVYKTNSQIFLNDIIINITTEFLFLLIQVLIGLYIQLQIIEIQIKKTDVSFYVTQQSIDRWSSGLQKLGSTQQAKHPRFPVLLPTLPSSTWPKLVCRHSPKTYDGGKKEERTYPTPPLQPHISLINIWLHGHTLLQEELENVVFFHGSYVPS